MDDTITPRRFARQNAKRQQKVHSQLESSGSIEKCTKPRRKSATSRRYLNLFYRDEIITARKRSLRRLCFYRCLSFILFTGGGACVAGGGVRGRGACMAGGGMRGRGGVHGRGGVRGGGVRGRGGVRGGGGMRGFIQLGGGVRGFIRGGMHGFIWGGCVVLFGGGVWVVLFGGACVVLFLGGHAWFFSFSGYNEIRSMSGRYASYWNAFLY